MFADHILSQTIESEEMRLYLSACGANKMQKIICGAPLSLARKLELLNELLQELSDGREKTDCLLHIHLLEKAMAELSLNSGDVFYLKSLWFDLDDKNRIRCDDLKPCSGIEEVRQAILDDINDEWDGEPPEDILVSPGWYEIEKWTQHEDESGAKHYVKSGWQYTLIGTDVCYFMCAKRRFGKDSTVYRDFEDSSDLNLPVPFVAGDIVTIDCRPFAPVQHALILAVGDNLDCCCLRAAFVDDFGKLCAGSIKHSHCFIDRYRSKLSPLYRMTRYIGKLDEDEIALEYIRRDLLRQSEANREAFGEGVETALSAVSDALNKQHLR